MSFAVVLEGMTLAAFAVLLVGGKQKREQGWGVLTILVALAAFVQAIGMALMVRDIMASSEWIWLTKSVTGLPL
jgi:formate hydrogenlyase subunit 3/multisubunit Na+/H+ antiporter MnhD subunit